MSGGVNYSALTPEEFLPFLEQGAPGAAAAAVEKLRELVDEYTDVAELEMAYEQGVEEGRQALANDLLSTYGAFFDDLTKSLGGDELQTLESLTKALKNP